MALSSPPSQKLRPSPFSSHSLLAHYRTIGNELLNYEREVGGFRAVVRLSKDDEESSGLFAPPLKNFREGVSFIAVEVLESYFDDLLDLEVSDRRLYIARVGGVVPSVAISLCGMLGALAVGLYAVASGAPFWMSFALTVCLALPFAVMWHFAPEDRLARRVVFAKVLSQEIARRRGSDHGIKSRVVDSEILRRLLGRGQPKSAQGAAMGAYH